MKLNHISNGVCQTHIYNHMSLEMNVFLSYLFNLQPSVHPGRQEVLVHRGRQEVPVKQVSRRRQRRMVRRQAAPTVEIGSLVIVWGITAYGA